MAQELIGRMNYGDSVSIYIINDKTADVAPLVQERIPPLEEDAGMEDAVAAYNSLIRVRQTLKSKLSEAISSQNPRAPVTDIMGAIDHYQPDPTRRSVLVFFSDMLESSDTKLDLEKVKLSEGRFQDVINALGSEHDWTNNTLKDAKVYVILPGAVSGEPKPINRSVVLKEFYSALFQALGARLASFDTSLPEGTL